MMDNDNPLREALQNLGMKKVISYIFAEAENEDSVVARTVAVMAGIIQLMSVQVYSTYDRMALRNEIDRVAEAFRVSFAGTHGDDNDSTELVERICQGYEEVALFTQTSGREAIEKANRATPRCALFTLEGVADCVVFPLMHHLPDSEIELIAKGEIDQKIIETVSTGMKKAYITHVNEEVENSFQHVARRMLMKRANEITKKEQTRVR